MINTLKLVGVVNVTNDSFSDGGKFLQKEKAIAHAHKLFNAGASYVDIGGDSTRPGSRCIGSQKEWNRISDVVRELSPLMPISVDTHNYATAEKAITCGAIMINDISGGADKRMLKVVSQAGIKYVAMASRIESPHVFNYCNTEAKLKTCINELEIKIKNIIEQALFFGVKPGNLILDPGMGAFVSKNELVSFYLLSNLYKVLGSNYSIFLGTSRKGFVARLFNISMHELRKLDVASVTLIQWAIKNLTESSMVPREIYVRVHNVKVAKALLNIAI
jgi:dihydropteroate synthase